jgi:hypothetical protein
MPLDPRPLRRASLNTDIANTPSAAADIKAEPQQPSFVLHTGDLTHQVPDDRLRNVLGFASMSFHM